MGVLYFAEGLFWVFFRVHFEQSSIFLEKGSIFFMKICRDILARTLTITLTKLWHITFTLQGHFGLFLGSFWVYIPTFHVLRKSKYFFMFCTTSWYFYSDGQLKKKNLVLVLPLREAFWGNFCPFWSMVNLNFCVIFFFFENLVIPVVTNKVVQTAMSSLLCMWKYLFLCNLVYINLCIHSLPATLFVCKQFWKTVRLLEVVTHLSSKGLSKKMFEHFCHYSR